MWRIIHTDVTERDYPEIGNDHSDRLVKMHALVADGCAVANRLEHVVWTEERVQVEPCESCGHPGCASGNYVELRRAHNFVVWAPSPAAFDKDRRDRDQYSPPAVVRAKGVLLFDAARWDQLRPRLGDDVPAASQMRPLTWKDAWLIAQLEAPHELLGEPGCPARPGAAAVCVATDPYVQPEELDRLADRQRSGIADDDPVRLLTADQAEVVTMFIDGYPSEARLYARQEGRWGLHLAPSFVALPI